jgi:monothiol glutaredoxin
MDDTTRTKLEELINRERIVLFMKGSKHFPMCGFSAKVVSILKQHGLDFSTVNVLADPAVRQAIKEYSNWPTIPQLYVDGEFVGGCDIVSQLHDAGELQKTLNTVGPT